MSILVKMQESLPELSKSERKVADYLLKYPHDVYRFSCEAIAANCKTSRSAVIRLCQRLGLRGYSELRYAIEQEPAEAFTIPEDQKGHRALQYYSEVISQLEPMAQSDGLGAAADTVLHSNRIIALGMSHSGLSASQLSFRLSRFGIDCYAITDPAVMRSYANILNQGDTVIICSISGNKDFEELVKDYRQNRVRVILLTMAPTCRLASMVDQVLVLPLVSHASNRYLLDDAITFFLFVELLIEAIDDRLHDRAKDRASDPQG